MKRNLRKYTKRRINQRGIRGRGRNFRKRSFFSRLSITNWLILVSVVFFIIFFPLMMVNEYSINYVAIKPSSIFQGKYLWTFVTSMFMHGGIFHLLINMFVLFSLGNLCEKIIGRKRYLIFYLVSGIIAGLFFVLLAYFFGNTDLGARVFGSPQVFAVGASGAIFALAGLLMVLTPRIRFMIIFLPFFSLPAYLMIPIVLFATWLVSSSVGWGVGNTAHLGGFLAGVVFALYLRQKYPRKARMVSKYFR